MQLCLRVRDIVSATSFPKYQGKNGCEGTHNAEGERGKNNKANSLIWKICDKLDF